MIRYALRCHDCSAKYEAWFASSAAYDRQVEAGLVACPDCDGVNTGKQIMAPAIGRGRTNSPTPGQGQNDEAFAEFAARTRRHIAENFDYVGREFAREARDMQDDENGRRAIWGQASPAEASALLEEGIPALPLPDGLAPKPPKSDKDVN